MSRSGEARKPRAEARVKALADENAALRVDRSNLETRVKELRAEIDAAAAAHREVKARLDGEIAQLKWDEKEALAHGDLSGRIADDKIAENKALRAENTRLQAAVESGATLLRIATRALGFYAEPGRWSHEPQGWAWAVTDEGPERAARAIESIRAKSPASDNGTLRNPSPEGTIDGGYDAGPVRDDR